MKKYLVLLLLLPVMLAAQAQDRMAPINLSRWMDRQLSSFALSMDQGVATTDSPTFAGGTFTGDVSANNITASPTLGAELITFDATFGSGANWAWSGTAWVHSTGATTALTSVWTPPTLARKYKMVVGVTHAGTGGITIAVAGITEPQLTATGTYTIYFWSETAAAITFTPTTSWTGSITALSIQEVSLTAGIVYAEDIDIYSGTIDFNRLSRGTNPYLRFNLPGGKYQFLTNNNAGTIIFGTEVGHTLQFNDVSLVIPTTAYYSWNTYDVFLYRESAATIQMGADAASVVTPQTFKACDGLGTDKPGAEWANAGGQGTGTGVGGDAGFKTALAGSTGSTVNAYGPTAKLSGTDGGFRTQLLNNLDSDTDEVDITAFASGGGMLILYNVTDGTTGIWRVDGTALVTISLNAGITAVKDNASTINVYFEGGFVKVQNKVGDNKVLRLGFMGV